MFGILLLTRIFGIIRIRFNFLYKILFVNVFKYNRRIQYTTKESSKYRIITLPIVYISSHKNICCNVGIV